MTAIPSDLFFTKSHEWIRDNGDGTVTVGISHYAQDKLGDVVFWDGPAEGDAFEKGETAGVVESVKAVSDVYSPISGEVVESNQVLEDSPEQVNEDPYGQGWMLKLTLSDASELEGTMDAKAYETLLAEIE
jgi:glycine cleavage system H protein